MIQISIMQFSISHTPTTKNRIGACLFDYRLSFWDQRDNYTFEKTFPTGLEHRQSFIIYAEFCTTWVTADTESNIQVWNLEKESCKILPKHHTKPIVDMKEIPQYKVIAV